MKKREWIRFKAESDGYLLMTDRQARLFACACARERWHFLKDERLQAAVELGERLADGSNEDGWEIVSQVHVARSWQQDPNNSRRSRTASIVMRCVIMSATFQTKELIQDMLRLGYSRAAVARIYIDLVGGAEYARPDRPCPECGEPWLNLRASATALTCGCGHVFDLFPAEWISAEAVSIAQHSYEQRDFSMLPVLADALEDRGCACVDALTHLREQRGCNVCKGIGKVWKTDHDNNYSTYVTCRHCAGTGKILQHHARGCWVVDLVRGVPRFIKPLEAG